MKKLLCCILLMVDVQSVIFAGTKLSAVIEKYSTEFEVLISYSPTLTGRVVVDKIPNAGNIEQRLDALLADTEFSYKKSGNGFYIFLDKNKVEERKRRIAAMEEERRNAAAEALRQEQERVKREVPEPGKMLPLNHGIDSANIAVIKPTMTVTYNSQVTQQRHKWYAIKTNALLLATTSANLSFEMTVGNWLSAELAYSGNYWNPGFGSLQHSALSATLRYWINGNEEGRDYIGAYIGYAVYDIGELKPLGGNLERFEYDGNLYSAGIVYGHRFNLGKHFALETELGMGYVHADYEKKDAASSGCASAALKSHSKNKFSITRAALNVCYIF